MQGFRKDGLSYLPLALAFVVAGLLVLVLRNYDSSPDKATASPEESKAIKRTEALLSGIPQHGAVLGDLQAPVTLQFFGDLQCRESRQVMLGALPIVIRRWVRNGTLRVVYRSLEVDTPDESEFLGQQIAALAAGRQGKMWDFVDLFYREQQPEFTSYADDAFLEGIARQTGVKLLLWDEARETGRLAGKIEADELLAEAKEMRSTPSFLIGPTGGEAHRLLHFSLDDPQVFDEAIRKVR